MQDTIKTALGAQRNYDLSKIKWKRIRVRRKDNVKHSNIIKR